MKLAARRQLSFLVSSVAPYWKLSFLLVILLLTTTALQLLGPQILKTFIDTAQMYGITKDLLFLALELLLITLLTQGVTIAETFVSEYVAWNATNRVRSNLLEHCLKLDLSFHTLHPVGEMIERIDGDVDTLSNFFSKLFIQLGGNILLLIGTLVIFFRLDWRIGSLLSLYILLFLFSMSALRKRIVPLWIQQRQISADFYGFLSEWLRGSADLRANGATSAFLGRFSRHLHNWFPVTRKAGLLTQTMNVVSFALISGTMLGLFLLGAYLHSQEPQRITIGTIFSLHNYLLLLLGPIWSVQSQLQELQQVEACIRRIENLLQTRSLLSDTGTLTLPEGPFSLECKHVTFGYTPGQPVLQDLSFALKPGKILGILGRTGSGKTTLARLLFRFYDVKEGELLLGDRPLARFPLQGLRQRIGLVTQDVQLFHASLRDNLTFFDRSIADASLLSALEQAGLLPWYQTLPMKLETPIGADGIGLSAGEAQLLAFARIFLHNPGLIILDEAASRLDPLSESLIERALDQLLVRQTVIIIAHRLSTVQRADDILILEDGKLLEYGPRSTLAADPHSHFSSLQRTGQELLSL